MTTNLNQHPVDKKRKKIVGEAEEPEIESENMELEPDLDSVFRYLDHPRYMIQHSHPIDIDDTENFNKDECFVFQSVCFDSQSKKLIIEKKDVKNYRKSRSEVNLVKMRPSEICQLHIETADSFDYSIGGIEAENARMKDWVKEFEEALIPMPLLASPLAIAMLSTPTTKLKGSSRLLTSCRGYVENNIKKIMDLIFHSWETSQTMASLGGRVDNFLEHL
jgi:hypothetical protein